jgi:hypothetical protein
MFTREVIVEELTRVAPFGLGLWDVVARGLVSEGLAVRIAPMIGGRPRELRVAIPNRAGIFVAANLPGMREFESGAGDEAFWASSPPATSRFLVEVRDTAGRFISFVLGVDLPPGSPGPTLPPCVAELGALAGELSSPPASPYVPLFSAPSRIAPAGMAAVRGTLVDARTGAPASFAVLELRYRGRPIASGVADDRGEVVALFPYPRLSSLGAVDSPIVSPSSPPPPMPPLRDQQWTLEVGVRYSGRVVPLVTDPPRSPLPDLCEIALQPPAASITTTASPPGPLAGETLRYGEELIIAGAAGGKLLIAPS